jgi:hypothetical protein
MSEEASLILTRNRKAYMPKYCSLHRSIVLVFTIPGIVVMVGLVIVGLIGNTKHLAAYPERKWKIIKLTTNRMYVPITASQVDFQGLEQGEQGVPVLSLHEMEEHPRLWIYVSSWAEGMSSWIFSVSQMLVLAQSLNATFVEPCMKNGRLLPCGTNATVKLTDIFDLQELIKLHPSIIASQQDFDRQAVTAKRFKICLTGPSRKSDCKKKDGPYRYGFKSIPELDEAISESTRNESVLEINPLWRELSKA